MVGIALVAGGIAAYAGVDVSTQVLIAAVVGAAGLFLINRWRVSARQKAQPGMADLDIGNQVTVEPKSPPGSLRVRYRGTQWDAELESEAVSLDKPLFIAGRRGNLLIIANKVND